MRKPKLSILVLLTLLFAAFTLGFFLGHRQSKSDIQVSVSKELTVMPQEVKSQTTETREADTVVFPISLNRADKDALAKLPGIGDVLAQRIVAYREQNGYFSSAEELLNVEGIGEKRLEEIIDLIVIGG